MSSPIKIGTVTLGRIPRLVGVCAQADPRVQRMPVRGMELWEARVDLWGNESLPRIRRQVGMLRATLPVIVTFRGKEEGGRATGKSAERARMYEALLDLADAIDIEMSQRAVIRTILPLCKAQRKTLILSYHDFQRTPPQKTLQAKIRAAEGMGADVVKLATLLKSNSDLIRLAQVQADHPRQNLATMGMGRAATLSRLLLASMGSVLVYGALEKATAPGQTHVSELTGLLRLAKDSTPQGAVDDLKLKQAA